ncbi:sugar transporter, partial [Paraburkholderia sp. SIMBA_009]
MSIITQPESMLGTPRSPTAGIRLAPWLSRMAIVATACALSACALSPGMSYRAPAARDANARVSADASGAGGLDGVQNVS